MTAAKVSWNPEQYLKFGDHRLRPAMDLLGRIDLESPELVYDLGCGTGNTTKLLADRWPDSRIVGIDSSAEMLEKARKSYANLEFIEADLESWNPQQEADLFYSNAALHWLGNHESLFPRLLKLLPKGAWFAAQMPQKFRISFPYLHHRKCGVRALGRTAASCFPFQSGFRTWFLP